MAVKPITTGIPEVDKALSALCQILSKHEDYISSTNRQALQNQENLDKRLLAVRDALSAMAVSFSTKSITIGDVAAGNYVEIKETGEIEHHGTNTLQINSGELYLKNGTTVERIRAENERFYIENQTAPSTWDELTSFF